MQAITSHVLTIALIFTVAGLVKGVAGMGLPTVAMGLLGLVTTPAQAAAFVVMPSLVTNVWQYLSGRHRLALARRTWPMLITICVTTWAAAGLMTGQGAAGAATWLGVALVAYAMIGFARIRLSVPGKYEVWLSPAVGTATGVVTGATGVFVIPAVPYLQALGFDKDDLIQVLGLSFTISTLALAVGLTSRGAFHIAEAGASGLCIAPALGGMVIGQIVRARVDQATFRRLFLVSLLLLGGDLIMRSVI
jgi:uncharacterized membrane protein YfcA